MPFEVKYRHQHTGVGDIKRLTAFCMAKKTSRGYVITREMSDFGVLSLDDSPAGTRLLKIPAPLACYWLGVLELQASRTAGDEE